MIEFCRKTKKHIYIYGYNQRTKLILPYLHKNNIQIKGIIVSDGQEKKSIDEPIDVYWLSEIDGDDCALIMGINYARYNDVMPEIIKKGIYEIYFIKGMKLYKELMKSDDTFSKEHIEKESIYYEENYSYQMAYKVFSYLIECGLTLNSAIDFGGGTGAWLKALKDINGARILTIDNSCYDRSSILNEKEFLRYDLTDIDINKIVNEFGRFDISISIEAAEHIDEVYADKVVKDLCAMSDVVLFSAAIRLQGGNGHVNEQRQSYWVERFKKNNYFPVDCIRPHFWNDESIHYHYRENCIMYVKENLVESFKELFPKPEFPFDVVHPDLYEKKMGMYQEGFLLI